jgi:hypothetical protein
MLESIEHWRALHPPAWRLRQQLTQLLRLVKG